MEPSGGNQTGRAARAFRSRRCPLIALPAANARIGGARASAPGARRGGTPSPRSSSLALLPAGRRHDVRYGAAGPRRVSRRFPGRRRCSTSSGSAMAHPRGQPGRPRGRRARAPAPPPRPAAATAGRHFGAGFTGGFLGTTTSMNGIPPALLLGRQRVTAPTFLADLAVYFVAVNALGRGRGRGQRRRPLPRRARLAPRLDRRQPRGHRGRAATTHRRLPRPHARPRTRQWHRRRRQRLRQRARSRRNGGAGRARPKASRPHSASRRAFRHGSSRPCPSTPHDRSSRSRTRSPDRASARKAAAGRRACPGAPAPSRPHTRSPDRPTPSAHASTGRPSTPSSTGGACRHARDDTPPPVSGGAFRRKSPPEPRLR